MTGREQHPLIGKSLSDLPQDAQDRWTALRDKLIPPCPECGVQNVRGTAHLESCSRNRTAMTPERAQAICDAADGTGFELHPEEML